MNMRQFSGVIDAQFFTLFAIFFDREIHFETSTMIVNVVSFYGCETSF